jgi:hypothetical protein
LERRALTVPAHARRAGRSLEGRKMPDRPVELSRMCRHCGAFDVRKLGQCVVCGLAVCEKCGNVQHTQGEHRVIHDACLSQDENAFTMIKFVK